MPKPEDNERMWAAYLAVTQFETDNVEHRLPCGARVDILTDEYAIEVEWCSKALQAPGQAVYYAVATARKPGVYLLLDRKPDENWLRCVIACRETNIRLWTIKTGK